MIMLALAALVLTPTIVDDSHSFESCRAAVAYATQAPEVGLLSYELTYGYSRAPQFARMGKVLFRVHLAIDKPVITLPQWTWPNATSDQLKSFSEFRANVLGHEEGHWRLAQDYIEKRDSTQWLPETMTREEAAAHFKVYFDTLAAGLQDAQNFYDSVTDHGRNQHAATQFGFTAGEDTLLRCQ